MFIPRKYEKYTNYNGYIVGKSIRMEVHQIEESRLLKVLVKLQEKYKNPYIRFMWVANTTNIICSSMCVLYSDFKKNERATKLVPFDDVERIIMGG